MSFKRKLGWVLLFSGTLVLVFPFIHGFTGYFAASYVSYLPSPQTSMQLPLIVAGFALALIGYFLVQPSGKSHVAV